MRCASREIGQATNSLTQGAFDDDGAQRTFSVIVRGRHVGVVQEGPQQDPGFEDLRAGTRRAGARRLRSALLQGVTDGNSPTNTVIAERFAARQHLIP